MSAEWGRSLKRNVAVLFTAALLAGCGGGGDSGGGAPPAPPPPTPGTATIDPRGGTVNSPDGVTVTVPANALAASTTIRIARDSTGAPAFGTGFSAVGDVYALTPHGTTFTEPVEMRMTIPPALRSAPDTLTIVKAEAGGAGWEILDNVRRDGDDLVAKVSSFSYFRIIGIIKNISGPFDVKVSFTACTPGQVQAPELCIAEDFTNAAIRISTTGDSFAACDLRYPVQLGVTAYPTMNDAVPRFYDGVSTVILPLTRISGTGPLGAQLPLIPQSIDLNLGLMPWVGRQGIYLLARTECAMNVGTGSFVPLTQPWPGAVIGFNSELGNQGATWINGVPYAPLRWIRQPGAPVGVEGQPLTLSGVLTGGASIGENPAATAVTQRRPATSVDSATVDWERSDDNGLSWRNVGRSYEYEANPDPFNANRPWRYWGAGYGMPVVSRADAAALFRGRACYTQPGRSETCATSATFRLTIAPQGSAPSVTSISPSQLVREGQTASFTAAAAGLPAPTLQWRQLAPGANAYTDIPGATGTTFTTGATTLAQNGTRYRVVATNSLGAAASTEVTLSVSAFDVAPTILTQPAPLAVVAGSEAVFAVDARGTEALSYAWRKDGVPIAGANSAVLKLAAVAAGAAGVYSVQVSNSAGNVTSTGAALTVSAGTPGVIAPSIVTQPADVTVTFGNTATFGVGAAGTGPFTYQWRRNGTAIAGATEAVYTIAAAVQTDEADYTVVVANSAGNVRSSVAVLVVKPEATPAATAPSITTQPASLAVFPGTTATLAVAASGSAPLAYEWSRNGTPIAGATSAVLTLANVTGAEAGSYTVTVRNGAGSAASSSATVIVIGAPAITSQPAARTITDGQSATFSVGASGDALRYLWTRNAVAIAGATGASYTTPALALADSGAIFAVIVYNGAGIVFSQSAVVTVNAAVTPPAPIDTIAAGFRHTCAIKTGGVAACWGYNSSGQIGAGNYSPWATPRNWTLPEAVRSVAAGDMGSCALTVTGRVFCAGGPVATLNVPTEVTGLGTVEQLAVGSSHVCALISGGGVRCWGNNSANQLGNGTTTGSSTPVTVLGATGLPLGGVTALEAGDNFTCAILAGGSIACWGQNNGAQSGQAVGTDTSVARAVAGLSGVTRIAAGAQHACVRLDDGTVRCWGDNNLGQYGNGTTSPFGQPPVGTTAVPGLSGVVSIASGTRHVCALLADTTVRCWGTGSMGNGDVSETRLTPAPVGFLSGVTSLAAGFEHTCALRNNQQLVCWGAGGEGQLGQGDLVPRTTPTAVPGGNIWLVS